MPTKNIVDVLAGYEAYQERRTRGQAANRKYRRTRKLEALEAVTDDRR